MAKHSVVYCVSGHGYGHSVRSAEIMRQLLELLPDCTLHIRTSAPRWLFESLLSPSVTLAPVELDSGVVEEDAALAVNAVETLERARSFAGKSRSVVLSEVAFAQKVAASLIVADIPYLAGDVAAAVGVPAIAVCNFTWDWIYEPYCEGRDGCSDLLRPIREGYSRIHTCLL